MYKRQELYSKTLEDLGFDPLPYYREAAAPTAELPLRMFIGLPDDEYFRTGMRHVPELRQRAPSQSFFMSPEDAQALSLSDGNWARVKTKVGGVMGRVYTRTSMPKGLVRVPHGWWMPESERGLEKMAGMWDFCDARITTDDDPELIDIEQGIPHMKGVPCAVEKLDPYLSLIHI